MTLLKTKKSKSNFPSLVDDFFNKDVFFGPRWLHQGGKLNRIPDRVPPANVMENGDSYKIEMAVPGLEKNDFKIEVEDGLLTISAEKEKKEKEEKENYSRKEFSYTHFSRSFSLPENSMADKVVAKYENGILTLTLPKKEITKTKHPKEIKVS